MLYITQLIYLYKGQEHVFEAFENVAIPTIYKYNGRLLLRVRPSDEAYLSSAIEKPYEIHLVEFATKEDFERFKGDEERKKFLHLRQQSLRASLMIAGEKLG